MSEQKKKVSPAWPVSIVVLLIVVLIGVQVYIDLKAKARERALLGNGSQIQVQDIVAPADENQKTNVTTVNNQVNNQNNKSMETSIDKLNITDVKVGTGAEAVAGAQITVNYLGTLLNGTKFDSSYDRGQPFTFTLGVGQVIQGWDEGFAGMKVGGKRRLVIPADMAYGNRAVGSIPANSTLVFEVELLDVKAGN